MAIVDRSVPERRKYQVQYILYRYKYRCTYFSGEYVIEYRARMTFNHLYMNRLPSNLVSLLLLDWYTV